MKEKLVELINDCDKECDVVVECKKECKHSGKRYPHCFHDKIADRLIANGVTVRKRAKWDDSGRYIFERGGKAICCTECGCALTEKEYAANHWNFCPVCGADMRGEEHETD